MGMSAEIFAVGPFRSELVPHLRHPAERYEAVAEGSIIIELVFSTYEGSTRSRRLASCFGADPWALGQHALDPFRADLDALRALFGSGAAGALDLDRATPAAGPGRDENGDVARFLALRAAGYQFYFLPNG